MWTWKIHIANDVQVVPGQCFLWRGPGQLVAHEGLDGIPETILGVLEILMQVVHLSFIRF